MGGIQPHLGREPLLAFSALLLGQLGEDILHVQKMFGHTAKPACQAEVLAACVFMGVRCGLASGSPP